MIAAAALSVSSTSAFAGASELKALQEALGATPIASATSAQLLAAFRTVLADPKFDTTKKQGVVAGEALKAAGVNAQNAGQVFADAIVAANSNPADVLNGIFADRRNFTALAAKTAGSGKGLNVLQIPGLAANIFVSEDSAPFLASAQAAKNKPGAGAILGGRARQFVSSNPATADALSAVLANSALVADVKLTAGAQDIARYIAAEINDTASFAAAVGNGNANANNKYAVAIAVGAAAGDPTNAGNIAHSIFGQNVLNTNGTESAPSVVASTTLQAAAVKGLSKLVKDMAAFADIEEIQKIGNAVGEKIQTGAIKLSKAASTVKTLATAVMNKPRTTAAFSINSDANKQDEIAEVAAYMVGGLIGSAELNALKPEAAASKLLAIITTAAKIKPKVTKGVANGPAAGSFSADVTGSVALTVETSSLPAAIKDAFQALLEDDKTAAKIDKNNVTAINDVIAGVYSNNATVIAKLESGLSLPGAVSDPETDFRPFNTPGGQS